jgi:hypothetical protein
MLKGMGMVHPCATERCGTLTMGRYCLACETDRRQPGTRELQDALRTATGGQGQAVR